jgi:hypothetical protein
MARFMRKGTTKVYFVPTIANLAAPTTAEITAGTVLTTQIAEVNGFTFTNNPIDTPDMGSSFVSKIPGEDTVDTSSFRFYEDKSSNPIRTVLAKGTNGYIVFFPSGTAGASPAAGDKTETWPVTVASNARTYSAGNEAASYMVVLSNTAAPSDGTLV